MVNETKASLWATLTLLVALCSAACSDADPLEHDQIQQDIFASTSTLWPTDRGRSSTRLSVCFENPSGFAQEIGWVRDAIEATWEDAAWLTFTGWGTCGSADIEIRIEDTADNPHVSGGLGILMDKMYLNFTFRNWGMSCRSSESRRRRCIQAIAIHEFGHALGLAHEHNRPDSSCDREPAGSYGDTYFAYDDDSVMNYCERFRTTLSRGDAEGIGRLYGTSGSAGHVRRGGLYAIMNQTRSFIFIQRGQRGGYDAGHIATVTNTGFGLDMPDSILKYDDWVTLRRDDRYLAAAAERPRQASAGTVIVTTRPYYWRVRKTTHGRGGNNVDVRDAFRLETTVGGRTVYLGKVASTGRSNPSHGSLFLDTGGNAAAYEWRFIGPIGQ